jgi:hypothetical protein
LLLGRKNPPETEANIGFKFKNVTRMLKTLNWQLGRGQLRADGDKKRGA